MYYTYEWYYIHGIVDVNALQRCDIERLLAHKSFRGRCLEFVMNMPQPAASLATFKRNFISPPFGSCKRFSTTGYRIEKCMHTQFMLLAQNCIAPKTDRIQLSISCIPNAGDRQYHRWFSHSKHVRGRVNIRICIAQTNVRMFQCVWMCEIHQHIRRPVFPEQQQPCVHICTAYM